MSSCSWTEIARHSGGQCQWGGPPQGRGMQHPFDTFIEWYAGYGTWTVFVARFVTGLRVVIAPAAGAAGMPWSRFFPANAAGAFAWACAVALLGYFFGRSWELLHHGLTWGSWIILGCALFTG